MAADLKTKWGLVIYTGLNIKRLYRKRDLHNAKRPTVCAFITDKKRRGSRFSDELSVREEEHITQ